MQLKSRRAHAKRRGNRPGRGFVLSHAASNTVAKAAMKYISYLSVFHALKERRCWGFCAAMTTDRPVIVGPNLRLL